MNKRTLKLDKYGITGKRYKELCGFCEQYPEWKDQLRFNTDTVHSVQITDMPVVHGNSDVTCRLATRRADISKKVDLIDRVAKQADPEFYEYLIYSVCYEKPFWYLRDILRMPCSERAFYDRRRYFFYLLDAEKKM